MSPEQADDPETVDFRGDIYSLGVTLYEAATGAPPFAMGDPPACLLAHKTQPVPPVASRVPGFPAAASSLLSWMLGKHPSERPQSYGALLQEMRRLLASLSAT
jgi:serine/threonine-protein kinase